MKCRNFLCDDQCFETLTGCLGDRGYMRNCPRRKAFNRILRAEGRYPPSSRWSSTGRKFFQEQSKAKEGS